MVDSCWFRKALIEHR